MSGACQVDFYVHQSTQATGPWTVIWSGSTVADGGLDWIRSPLIDVTMNRSQYYTLGYAFSCSADYYAGALPTGTQTVVGAFQQEAFYNGYAGYDPGFNGFTLQNTGRSYTMRIVASP